MKKYLITYNNTGNESWSLDRTFDDDSRLEVGRVVTWTVFRHAGSFQAYKVMLDGMDALHAFYSSYFLIRDAVKEQEGKVWE